jgi:hypothetical protein
LYLFWFIICSSFIYFLLVVAHRIGWWRDWKDNPNFKCCQTILECMDIWKGWREHHAKVHWNKMPPKVPIVFVTEKGVWCKYSECHRIIKKEKNKLCFTKVEIFWPTIES